jgi:hypothetical protein
MISSKTKVFGTYVHCRPDGSPFYVGKGTPRRARLFSVRSEFHKNVVRKYGQHNIGVFYFESGSEQQAIADEIHQIKQLRSAGCTLVNMTDGGDGVSGWKRGPLSASHKRKIGDANRGRKLSDAHKLAVSLAQAGCVGHRLGRKNSLEHIAKYVAARTGQKDSLEVRARKSASAKAAWARRGKL